MKKTILAASAALLLASCAGNGTFSISGNIEGADNQPVLLENSINGYWVPIDSTRTDGDGDFKIKHQSPDVPQVYRLTVNDRSVYFPVDSLDDITIKATLANFATDYSLTGSDNAENMASIDHRAREIAAITDAVEAAKKREEFKRELAQQLVATPASVLAYYIINKQINGVPLFDFTNSVDLRIIGAVANAYSYSRPNDPRTANIVKTYLAGKKATYKGGSAPTDTMYVDEAKILEIALPDENGKIQSLQKLAEKGGVVLLNFTTYEVQESPAFNKLLSDLYNANKGRGLEIYQVGIDTNVSTWKTAASNLPWITVYDEAGTASRNLAKYNVQAIPAIFLIDRSGEIAARVTDLAELPAQLKKLL